MNDDRGHALGQEVLFCPFCRDSFEGARRCPDHDLELVAWHKLPRLAAPIEDTARVAPFDLRFGRGWVLLGAGLTVVAFLLPMLTMGGETELHANMFRFASLRAGKLWMVPLSAIAQAMILFRRRTPAGMRRTRVAVAVVALMPSVALAITLRGVFTAAEHMSRRTGEPVAITIEWGSYVVIVAALFMLYGAARLGITPHAVPEDETALPVG